MNYTLHIFGHQVIFFANDSLHDDACYFGYDNGQSTVYDFGTSYTDIRNAIQDAVNRCGFKSPWNRFECNSDRLFEIRQLIALFFHPQVFFEDEGWEDFLIRPKVSQ